jgi:L-ascorbate metabolism protein UlaG (beta-lactamase superfamily)
MPRVHIRPLLLGALLGVVSGCRWITAGNPAPFSPAPAGRTRVVSLCASICTDSVDVAALGVDGFLIVPWRDTTQLAMTPPGYRNPSLWHLVLRDWWWGTRANPRRVANGIMRVPGLLDRLPRVRAVLVGHGHYDHTMDIPEMLAGMPNATIYGSETVAHLLRPVFGSGPVRATAVHPGQDLAIGPHLQARALAWGHAPNVGGWTIAAGRYTTDLRALPRSVQGWRMGEPLAWTIDVLDDDHHIALRIVHHDAAADLAIVRAAVAEIRSMPPATHTVLIMTAANWDQAASYPGALLASLEPDRVLLGHWEDFFRDPAKRPKVVRGIQASALVREVERFVGPRWSVLEPGATLRVRTGR